MTHPFMKAVHAIKKNPSTRLFHGSPVSGITEFDLSKKRTEDVFLTEGRGVYLTSHFDTAKSYGPYVYEVKIKGPIFDATKFESLRKILDLVKQETDVDLTRHKEILKALDAMVEGRYSILAENGLVWQIKLNLDSDEDFAQRADDIEAVSNVVERAINEVKAMKYFDPKISKSPLYIVRDPKCVEIVREIKTNPKEKVGSSEIFTSDVGSKSFHLNKGKGVWLVSWEPHTFNIRRFAKKSEAVGFIKSKLKEKSNPAKLKQVAPNHYEGIVANEPILVALDEDRDCWIVRCGKKGKRYFHRQVDSLFEAKKLVESWLMYNAYPVESNPKEEIEIQAKTMDELSRKVKEMKEKGCEYKYRFLDKEKALHCAVMVKVRENPKSEPHDYSDLIDDIMNLHHQAESINAIARRLRISPPIVKKLLEEQGVDIEEKQRVEKEARDAAKRKVKPNPEIDYDEEILQLYQGGKSIAQVARKIGESEKKVSQALKRMGIPLRQASPRIERFTVEDILKRINAGKSVQDIADEFSTTSNTIYKRLREAGIEQRAARKKKNLNKFMKDVKE